MSTFKPDLTADTQRRRSPISLLTAHLAGRIYLHCFVRYHICCCICIFIALSNTIFVVASVFPLLYQLPYLFLYLYLHRGVKYHICSCICIFNALSNTIFVLVTVFPLPYHITIFVLVSVFASAAKFHNWSRSCICRLRYFY